MTSMNIDRTLKVEQNTRRIFSFPWHLRFLVCTFSHTPAVAAYPIFSIRFLALQQHLSGVVGGCTRAVDCVGYIYHSSFHRSFFLHISSACRVLWGLGAWLHRCLLDIPHFHGRCKGCCVWGEKGKGRGEQGSSLKLASLLSLC